MTMKMAARQKNSASENRESMKFLLAKHRKQTVKKLMAIEEEDDEENQALSS